MKFKILLLSLSMLLIAFPVFGAPDLRGTWCVSMSAAYSHGEDGSSAYYDPEENEIEITDQDETYPYGTLFVGYVVNPDQRGFSGVLDGKTISMTHWDSVTRGELLNKNNKALEIHFINNAFQDNKIGKTSIGIAVKGNCPIP